MIREAESEEGRAERPQTVAKVRIGATDCGGIDEVEKTSPFDAIYDTYAPLLRRIAVAKFGISANDAADLVHDVFATYLVNPARVNELRPYLIGAICNASRSYLRRANIQGSVCTGLDTISGSSRSRGRYGLISGAKAGSPRRASRSWSTLACFFSFGFSFNACSRAVSDSARLPALSRITERS